MLTQHLSELPEPAQEGRDKKLPQTPLTTAFLKLYHHLRAYFRNCWAAQSIALAAGLSLLVVALVTIALPGANQVELEFDVDAQKALR